MIRRLLLAFAVALLPASVLASDVAPREEIRLRPGTPPGDGKVEGPEQIGGEGSGLGTVSNVAVPRMRVYRPAVPNAAAPFMDAQRAMKIIRTRAGEPRRD